MTMKTLNPTILDSLKDGACVFDAPTPGLFVRVGPRKKAWGFAFTVPGTKARTRLTLGTYPATGLPEARALAEKARAVVEGGKDPRCVTARPAEKTIAELVDDRIALELRADSNNYKRSCMEIERVYDKDVIPVVGSVPVKDFRITHLNMVTGVILKRGAAIHANRVFEHVRALLNFAVKRGEIDFSPLARANKPSKEVVRDRFLTLPEIQAVWTKAPAGLGRVPHASKVVRLCLCLGQRLGEVAGMRRDEIDQQNRVWTIPKDRSKNGHAHVVPMNDLAWAIVHEALRAVNGEYLFPVAGMDRPVTANQLAHGIDWHQDRFGIPKWRAHDLRRTVATQMSREENKLDIPDFHISQVLNHRSATAGSITHRVYIQNTYVKEKKDALDKWGAFLAKLVGEESEQQEAA